MALLDLSWMVEFLFAKLSLVTLKKSSTCSSKFLMNFIQKGFIVNNGCRAIYCIISNMLAALLDIVLKIRIDVKCVHVSRRA